MMIHPQKSSGWRYSIDLSCKCWVNEGISQEMGGEQGVPVVLHTQFCKLKTNMRWWCRHWEQFQLIGWETIHCHCNMHLSSSAPFNPAGSDHWLTSLIVVYTCRVSHMPYAFWLKECNQNKRTKARCTLIFKIERCDAGNREHTFFLRPTIGAVGLNLVSDMIFPHWAGIILFDSLLASSLLRYSHTHTHIQAGR
jgi:hypothetical protein